MNPKRTGALLALSAYTWWGLSPIFWKQLGDVAPVDLTAWRAVMTVALLGLIIATTRRLRTAREVARSKQARLAVLAGAVLIAGNWGLYVWAIAEERIIEASLGYFMNPLVSVFLGVVFLGEQLRRPARIAVGFAAAGVLWLTFAAGTLPWVSLLLAFSFGLYGLVRKLVPLDSFVGLGYETAIILGPALLVLGLRGNAVDDLQIGAGTTLLIVATGVVTAVPLVLFSQATQYVDLSVMGLLQYVAPTLQLLVGVIGYGEAFGAERAVGYILIWIGLVVFASDEIRSARAPGASQPRARVKP